VFWLQLLDASGAAANGSGGGGALPRALTRSDGFRKTAGEAQDLATNADVKQHASVLEVGRDIFSLAPVLLAFREDRNGWMGRSLVPAIGLPALRFKTAVAEPSCFVSLAVNKTHCPAGPPAATPAVARRHDGVGFRCS